MQSLNLINKVKTKDIQETYNKSLMKTDENISSTNNNKFDESSFKDVLEVKKNDILKPSDESEKDLTEIEESIEDLTLEEVIDCLSMLVQMLVQEMPQKNDGEIKDLLGLESVELNLNEEVTSIISKVLNEGIVEIEGLKSNELISITNNLLGALKDENIKNTLDETSLKSFEGLLKKIENESSIVELPVIKEAIKEIENLLVDKKSTSLEKVGIETLKVTEVKSDDSKVNAPTTTNNNTNNTNSSTNEEELINKEKSTATSEVKETVSKEEKVLKSILGEDDDSKVSKFSLFTDRTISTKVETISEAPVINKTTVVEDVIKSVKYMETNALKELTVKINPKELGEIAIKLVQEDGAMKANIKANNKDTFSLLSQNLNDIRKYLGEQNIKISEVNIELYQEDTTFFKEGEFNNNFNEERERTSNKSTNSRQVVLEDDLEEDITLEDLSNISMLV